MRQRPLTLQPSNPKDLPEAFGETYDMLLGRADPFRDAATGEPLGGEELNAELQAMGMAPRTVRIRYEYQPPGVKVGGLHIAEPVRTLFGTSNVHTFASAVMDISRRVSRRFSRHGESPPEVYITEIHIVPGE